jgi:hypothetical protein
MDNLLFAMWLPDKKPPRCHGYPASCYKPSSLPWNRCPLCAGITVQFAVESLSTLVWNTHHPCCAAEALHLWQLNRIQSTRRLETAIQRNVELMWMTCHLMPDFKTIAGFRKDNVHAIRNVRSRVIVLCRQLGGVARD